MHQLGELTDPNNGQHVVRRVWRREDLYHGPFLSEAPDLIVEWVDYAYWGRASFDQPTTPVFQAQRFFEYSSQPLSGSHRPQGILIAHGPRIQPGAKHAGAQLQDVATTVLHLLQVAPTTPLDGKLLSDWLLEPDSLDPTQPVDPAIPDELPQHDYTAEEAQVIAERLRALGYL
jgi:predicted AlkP superfamily phosphohydrolase/phosphomutase